MCRTSGVPRVNTNGPNHVVFINNFLSKSVPDYDQDYLSCPISLLLLLSTLLGSGAARGNTATQLSKAMNLKSRNNLQLAALESRDLFKELLEQLTREEAGAELETTSTVKLANGLFTAKNFLLHTSFVEFVKNDFEVYLESNITIWSNNSSCHSSPNPQAEWEHKFRPTLTRTQEFHVCKSGKINVQMMQGDHYVHVLEIAELKLSIMKKALQGKRFSLIIALPNEDNDLEGANRILAGEFEFKKLFEFTEEKLYSLKMPKFNLETHMDVIPATKAMGVTDLFTRGLADLTGLSREPVFIGIMKQGTMLKVHESGVEAAAVTAAIAVPMSYIHPAGQFHVNRSFVAFIYDDFLGVPLFSARVIHPK